MATKNDKPLSDAAARMNDATSYQQIEKVVREDVRSGVQSVDWKPARAGMPGYYEATVSSVKGQKQKGVTPPGKFVGVGKGSTKSEALKAAFREFDAAYEAGTPGEFKSASDSAPIQPSDSGQKPTGKAAVLAENFERGIKSLEPDEASEVLTDAGAPDADPGIKDLSS